MSKKGNKVVSGAAIAAAGLLVGGSAVTIGAAIENEGLTANIDAANSEKISYVAFMEEIRQKEISYYNDWKSGEISTEEYGEMLTALSLEKYLSGDNTHLNVEQVEEKIAELDEQIEGYDNERSENLLIEIGCGCAAIFGAAVLFDKSLKGRDKFHNANSYRGGM